MSTRNHRIRFCDNNFLENELNAISFSSEKAGFEFEFARNPIRGLFWTPDNNFTIELDKNDKAYIYDGVTKSVTLVVGDYTGTTLASHLTTRFNNVSSGWSVTYNTTTKKFSVTRTGGELILSNQTEAVWNDIGFTGLVNLSVNTTQIADERRIHNFEYIKFDLGYNGDGLFFALIGPSGEDFSLSPTCVITIEGNSIDDFENPPFSVQAGYTDEGFYKFFDDQLTYSYRYWRIKINDRTNPEPNNIKISHVFLGNYTTFTTRNISNGFNFIIEDLSDVSESVNGGRFFNKKPQRKRITSSTIDLVDDSTRSIIYEMVRRLGTTRSFYVSVDPTLVVNQNINELTFFANFDGNFEFNHVFRQYYNFRFNVVEAN